MALRDHSLDAKIEQAAFAEFMEHGYQKASLHKIAERASVSTGALYTRYNSKDELFCSLVQDALEKIRIQLLPLQNNYSALQKGSSVEAFLEAIHFEKKFYLDILFNYYDECVLFICRSEGSSIGIALKEMMNIKARQTVTFLKSIARQDFDGDSVEIIMSMQFYYFQQVLMRGYSREKAFACMQGVEDFLESGWKELLEKIL